MLVAREQFVCMYKKWFRPKTIIYLQIMLYSAGTWKIAINTQYYKEEVDDKLWREIKAKSKTCIIEAQERLLKSVFRTNKYSDLNTKLDRMEASYKECSKCIDEYSIFEGLE